MKELQIKAALIDYLLKKSNANKVCISHEVRFNDSNRRADLVYLGKYIEAFEIKSKYDSITTLRSQINDYQKCFQKTSVVTTQNHLLKVLQVCPESIGILLIDENSNISEFRKAPVRKKLSKIALLRMVKGKDINQKTRTFGTIAKTDDINTKRTKLSLLLNLKETIAFAKSSIWDSSIKQYESFLKERGKVTSTDDIFLLSLTPRSSILQNHS